MTSDRRTTPATARSLARYYPDTETDFQHFSRKTRALLPEEGRILDLGAGTGIISELEWRGPERRVYGFDLDPRVGSNCLVDRSVIGDGFHLSFENSSFDAAVSVNVFEHLADPLGVLSEVHRVLKPGGCFSIKTPNRDHYIGWVSRLTPTWFHQWYNQLRGRESEDTFSTYYRFNRFHDVRSIAERSGFELVELEGFEGVPEYLLLSALMFYPGLWYERWVNTKTERNRFRANLEIVLRKPST